MTYRPADNLLESLYRMLPEESGEILHAILQSRNDDERKRRWYNYEKLSEMDQRHPEQKIKELPFSASSGTEEKTLSGRPAKQRT